MMHLRRITVLCFLAFFLFAAAWLHRPAAFTEEPEQQPVISAGARLAAKAIRAPEGFQVTPVASEPNLANPVAFCFDPQGRIFVAETHRVGKGVEDNRHHMDWLDDDLAARTVADRRAYTIRRMGDEIHRFTTASDQVRLLDDRNDDGLYEHSTIFSGGYNAVEDGAAAGVLWLGDRLWFTCIPALYELRDRDGDGRADDKRVIASGFGVHNAFFGHDLHGLCEGADGRIYFSIGDRGLHVETADGVVSNPDSGAILRCNPDGSELEIVATGLRNPQELAFNEFGDLFTVDNNSDSGDMARLVHVVEGMDAGWRMSFQYLPDRGPFNREKIWHTENDEQPASIVPPLAHVSDGPSGLVYYPGTGLPQDYEGAFFLCDFRGQAGTSGIRHFWVEKKGATYRLAKDSMFVHGVLATDCDFGPDGAFYIADWVDGWSGTGMGRIHRLVSGDPASAQQREDVEEWFRRITEMPPSELLGMLRHANMRVRLAAQKELVSAGGEATPLVTELAAAADAPLLTRLHAVWAIGQLGQSDPRLFVQLIELCRDDNAEVRAQAAKTLARAASAGDEQRVRAGKALTKLLDDPQPRVRSFAAISLASLGYEPSLVALLHLAREDGGDPVLRHATAVGLAGTQAAETLANAGTNASDAERLALVIALGRQKSPLVARFLGDDSPRVRLEAARVIWDTPVPGAYAHLAALIDDSSVEGEPLLRRVLAANNSLESPAHLRAVIDWTLRDRHNPAMREHAWDLVRRWPSPSPRDPVLGAWRPIAPRSQEDVVAAIKNALPKIARQSASHPHGLVVAAELGIEDVYVPLVAVIGDADHSDELRSRALTALSHADEAIVATALEAGLQSKRPALRSAARRLLVRHFPERAVEELREAIDHGTTQERQTAIELIAQLDTPAARAAISEWIGKLAQGSCPPELQLEVLEAARQSRDPALVAQAKQYANRVSGEPPAVAYGASLQGGDRERGERIFDESTALSCRRCHAVEPGPPLVGPNLSDAGLRRSREELLVSIVRPNEKITEGFQTVVFLLDTGQVVSGIVRHEDESHVVLIDADGKEIVVELDSVEDRYEGQSAMPEDLMKHMTERDLRDLVEYLSSLRTPNTEQADVRIQSVHGGHGAAANERH